MIVLPSRDHLRSPKDWMLTSSLSEPHQLPSSMMDSIEHLRKPVAATAVATTALPAVVDIGQSFADNSEDFPELPDDMLMEVLAKLEGRNRHAVSRSCRRLRHLAYGTFSHVGIPVPAVTSSFSPSVIGGAQIQAIPKLSLQLPAFSTETGPNAASAPTAALDSFLSQPLPSLRTEALRIRAFDSHGTTCQISHSSLAKLATACQCLQRLHLPLLGTSTAAALPLFSNTLTSLTLTVADGPTLNYALQLSQLRHLSISTRKGLMYLLLSQRQVCDLAQMSGLQSLALHNVLLNDCRMSWEPLSALTSLTDLQLSSPFSTERLQQLPASLRRLQMPFFAGSLEALPTIGPSLGLTELRCRQAFTEQDLAALSHLPCLTTLQCDNVVVSESVLSIVQAAAAAAASGEAASGRTGASVLPVLKSVTTLRLTGYHTYNGVLGLMFPGLETLQVMSLAVPRPPPMYTALLPSLQRLAFPSCKVLPAVLAACPILNTLVVPGINCQQRLDELLHLPHPEPGHGTDGWWPAKLCNLTLGFSSSLRFRPKQVVAALAGVPEAVQRSINVLVLRDSACNDANDPGRVVDDNVLAAAVRSLRQLRELRLSDCAALTCSGLLHALEAAAPRLGCVTVAGCAKVSRTRAERVPGLLGRPWLDVTWREGGDV